MTLITLIRDIQAGPVTRELSDRVLLACTKWSRRCVLARDPADPGSGTVWQWTDPKGRIQGIYRPDPLDNLQDATLAVPEGWRIAELREKDPTLKHMLACVTLHPFNGNDAGWKIGPVHGLFADELPVALTLAALKAREREAEG